MTMIDTQEHHDPRWGQRHPLSFSAAVATAIATGAASAWWLRHRGSLIVQRWEPSTVPVTGFGSLHARVAGDGDRAFVLLHGLVSTGDVFGASFDRLANSGRLVVPDLLGFGRSLDESRDAFTVEAHLDALDDLAERTGLFERRWTIGAHSMGSALAMRWAARHHERVDKLVCWGAPVFPSPEIARSRITGSMARLLVLDTRAAEFVCRVSCSHRRSFGRLAMLLEPRLPRDLARSVSLHTWAAYRDALSHFVIDADWPALLDDLDRLDIPIEMVWGTADPVGDPDLARQLTANSASASVRAVLDADHYLPMSHPDICLSQLRLTTDLTASQGPPKTSTRHGRTF